MKELAQDASLKSVTTAANGRYLLPNNQTFINLFRKKNQLAKLPITSVDDFLSQYEIPLRREESNNVYGMRSGVFWSPLVVSAFVLRPLRAILEEEKNESKSRGGEDILPQKVLNVINF